MILPLLLACAGHRADRPPAGPGAELPASPDSAGLVQAFGAGSYGFIDYFSPNQRFVAYHRFDKAPEFGHHGEPRNGAPVVVVLDRSTGAETVQAEFLGVEESGRWFLTQSDSDLLLWDSTTGQTWSLSAWGADISADSNTCIPHRGATLGDGVITFPAGEVVVRRDLVTGVEQRFTAEDRVWRTGPTLTTTQVTAILAPVNPESPGSWPVERTSCACMWCNRFAASYGRYGWSGAFEPVVLGADGAAVSTVRVGVGLGFVILDGPTLFNPDGTPYALDEGCEVAGSWFEALLLDCGDTGRLLTPQGQVETPGGLTALLPRNATHVMVRQADGRVGRISVKTGRWEPGPVMGEKVVPRQGLVASAVEGALVTYDLDTGASTSWPIGPWSRVSGNVVVGEDGSYTLYNLRTGASVPLSGVLATTSLGGCVVTASGQTPEGADIGPWQVICP